MTDWEHSILEFLREQYSPYNTPLNNFLIVNLNVDPLDLNQAKKLRETLDGLQKRDMLVWISRHKQDVWPLGENNPGKPDGTISNNSVEARLTFEGLVYTQNRKIAENQLLLSQRQYSLEKKIGGWSTILAAISAAFIAITTIQPFFEPAPQKLDTVNREVQEQSKTLKNIESSLKEINSSIQKLKNDSLP